MMRDYSLLEVKEHRKALKEQFLLIFLSAVEGIFTAEKRATTFLSSFLKNLVLMTSTISCFFSLSERYHYCSTCTVFFFFFCRLLVEKIFAQYLVPHNLETEERMKCLYYLYASLDPNAVK